MPGFERAATIDRPPRQVYAVLDDIHGARQWMPAIRCVEVLTPEFAVDVGYRWRETRAIMGIFRMSAELEVVEHDAPRTWGVKYEDKKMRMTATFELTPSGDGTLIALREEVTDLQGKAKRAERTAKWMEKADDDLLLRLKAHVEGQPAWPAEPAEEPPAKPRKRAAARAKKPRTATKKGKKAKRQAPPQPAEGEASTSATTEQAG